MRQHCKFMYNKLSLLLEKKYKKQVIILVFLYVFINFLEIVGLSSVPILVSLLLENSKLFDIFFLQSFKSTISEIPKDRLLLYFSLSIIGFFLIKNLLIAYLINFELNVFKGITVDLKKKIFDYHLNIPYIEHLSLSSSIVIRAILTDTTLAVSYLLSFLTIISQFILLLFSLLLLMYWNFKITFLTVSIFFLFSYIIYKFASNRVYNLGKLKQYYTKETHQVIIESINNIIEVIIYSKDSFLTSLFKDKEEKAQDYNLKISLYKKMPKLIYEVLGVSLLITVIIYNISSNYPIEETIIFISLLTITIVRILPSLNLLSQSYSSLKSSEYSFNLIIKIIKNNFKKKNINKNHQTNFQKSIKFENIKYTYPNVLKRSIENFNFEIEKNSIIGIVGKSGSGKSTFVNLLAGLLSPSSGNIYIDNKSIIGKEYLIQSKIGYIPQNNYLIDDTILKNIIFSNRADNIDYDLLKDCLNQSQLSEFIESLKEGVNTHVGEKGMKISGGQRQRIGIARALYNKPEILIFDESFNSLDRATEQRLLDEIYRINDQTIIIISHKLENLYKCNKVMLIENGEIKRIGTQLEIGEVFK